MGYLIVFIGGGLSAALRHGFNLAFARLLGTATGILGGYTTFSTFSLDVALLYERGEPGLAALYVLLSVALSIAGLFAGIALVRNFA